MGAQTFVNGQAARAVIGETTFSGVGTPSQQLVGGVSGLAYANGQLFVADSNLLSASPIDNRVLMFSTTQIPAPHTDLTTINSGNSVCKLCGYSATNVLGQPDYTSTSLQSVSNHTMNVPTGVATDGNILAVSDTDNNRVLIWRSIPASINQPADLVLGQPDFTTHNLAVPPTASSLRGPQGLWIQNGKLFVADTQNYRILIWNSIPTSNNQAADVVLGQSNFNSGTQAACDPTKGTQTATGNELCNPVSVTSDGTRLFVADLGFNRVLIWNSIPASNGAPANVAVGQPDLTGGTANNYQSGVCGSNSTGPIGQCVASLNFPTYALSDGTRLFVADGGNDRVLIFNTIPTTSGASADVVLGQPDFTSDVVTSQTPGIISTAVDNTGSVDTIQGPQALAYDGSNLYVTDPFNGRVLVFTPGDTRLPDNSVVNSASEIIRQEGVVALGLPGSIVASDTVTITINGTAYVYTLKSSDTLDTIAQGLVSAINANSGDPNVTAIFAGAGTASVYLSSKQTNLAFDSITLAAVTSDSANITATPSGGYLSAGTAATAAPGMIVEIDGTNLADSQTTINANFTGVLADTLGGVQVFMDGIAIPIWSVSSTKIVCQVPYTFVYQNSVSVYVRTVHSDGSITVTNATPVYIAAANPGIFSAPSYAGQPRPWPAIQAFHQPGNPTAVVSVDGTATAGNTATITIGGKAYNYTEVSGDTLTSIVNGLVTAINSGNDPNVTAAAGAAFNRVVLTARQGGAAGTGISVAASASSGATVTMTAYTSSTCCAVTPNSPISASNPAGVGELITVSASGLGILSNAAQQTGQIAGVPYGGPQPNTALASVSGTMGGSTAQVIGAGLPSGSYGVYQVQMIVPTSLSANSATQVYIAQNAFVGNIATVPVGTPLAVGAVGGGGPPGAGLANAQILVNPINLVFSGQNTASLTQAVTVTNPQGSALGITGVQVTGSNASSFQATNTCGNSLPAGSSCTVSITYTAGATGIQTASLAIFSGASVSPQIVPMTGVNVAHYEIINKLSGKVLDVTGGSASNGALIQQWSLLDGDNQKWSLAAVGDGSYAILNLQSGKVLDVTGSSIAAGAAIQQWDYLGGDNQKWTLQPAGDGYYSIVSVLSGKVLDVTDMSTVDGARIQQWDYLGGDNQKWLFAPDQFYEIVNVNSGRVLDVTNASTSNGTVIQQWDYLSGGNQKWALVPVGGGAYSIMNFNSGKVLDVTGGSIAAGAAIQQWDYLGGDNQKWTLQPAGNGSYAIENVQSGDVLDVTSASLSDGARLQQWPYLGGANQQWQLVPVQYYEIANLNSGKVLDVTSQSTSAGALIQQYDYLGGANQQWALSPAGGVYYWIINRNSGMLLDATGGSNAAGTLIEQNNALGADYQKWALAPSGNGYYSIVNKATGRVLDVTGASTSNTAPIQQYDYLGGANQQWQLIPVGLPTQ